MDALRLFKDIALLITLIASIHSIAWISEKQNLNNVPTYEWTYKNVIHVLELLFLFLNK